MSKHIFIVMRLTAFKKYISSLLLFSKPFVGLRAPCIVFVIGFNPLILNSDFILKKLILLVISIPIIDRRSKYL